MKKPASRKQSNVSAGKKAGAKKGADSDEDMNGDDDEEEKEGDHKELFVGNMAFSTDENGLRNRFKKYGNIVNLKLLSANGRSKGVAFVEYSSSAEAQKAIKGENGNDLDGRSLKVTLSNDKPTGGPGGRD